MGGGGGGSGLVDGAGSGALVRQELQSSQDRDDYDLGGMGDAERLGLFSIEHERTNEFFLLRERDGERRRGGAG